MGVTYKNRANLFDEACDCGLFGGLSELKGDTMKQIIFALSAVLAVAVYPVNARPDWQYTHWGMTVEEVLKASNGQLQQCTPQLCKGSHTETMTPGAVGAYESGQFKFNALLSFDKEGKLGHVQLELVDPNQYPSLLSALRAKYGEPADQGDNPILMHWRWHTETDEIALVVIGNDNAVLVYTARMSAENKGL